MPTAGAGRQGFRRTAGPYPGFAHRAVVPAPASGGELHTAPRAWLIHDAGAAGHGVFGMRSAGIWRNRERRATVGDMSQIQLRRATTSDADRVAELLFDFNTEFQSPTPATNEFAARFRRLLAMPEVVVLLAGGDEPVGFALLTLRPTPYFDGPLAQLEELYVRPRLRNQGLGTALLEAAIRLVRERDAGEMHINVDEIDIDTRRFYERHGFVNIEPGGEHRMLCYLREL